MACPFVDGGEVDLPLLDGEAPRWAIALVEELRGKVAKAANVALVYSLLVSAQNSLLFRQEFCPPDSVEAGKPIVISFSVCSSR